MPGRMSGIVIYEDSAILVVNKPAGLLSLQDGYEKNLPYLKTTLEPDYGPLWMVHRLDRDTSGVLVIARSAAAHHNLNDQFIRRSVHKIYHALVRGVPDWDEIQADFPLRKNGDRQHRTVIDYKRGKPAQTHFRALAKFSQAAFLEASPQTGYTHQIRAHAAYLGFPILGDSLYSHSLVHPTPLLEVFPLSLAIHRVALHACSISFCHPSNGEEVQFFAPYPEDFDSALHAL